MRESASFRNGRPQIRDAQLSVSDDYFGSDSEAPAAATNANFGSSREMSVQRYADDGWLFATLCRFAAALALGVASVIGSADLALTQLGGPEERRDLHLPHAVWCGSHHLVEQRFGN